MTNLLDLQLVDPAELGARLGIIENEELSTSGLADLARTAVRRWQGAPRRTVQFYLSRQLEAAQHPEHASVAKDCLNSLVLLGDVGQLDVAGRSHLFPVPTHVVRVDSEAFILGYPDIPVSVRAQAASGTQRYVRWIDDPADVERLLVRGAVDWDLQDWLAAGPSSTEVPAGRSLWQVLHAEVSNSKLMVEDLTQARVVGPWSSYFGGLRGEKILAEAGRWQALDSTANGAQLGARRGYTEHHWHPCVLQVDQGIARVVDLRSWDAFAQALVARGVDQDRRERLLELPDGTLQQTCPLPSEIVRLLSLLASPGKDEVWRWYPIAAARPALGQTLRDLGLDVVSP